MHIVSKLLFVQPRIYFRALHRPLIFNQRITKELTQPKQVLFKQPIRCNQIDTVYKRFKKADPIKLKLKDGVPEFYRLIYRNTMYNYFISAQILSTVLGVLTVIFIPILYREEGRQENVFEDIPAPKKEEVLFIAAGLIGLCVALQVMLRRCPMRIYNLPRSNKYVFVFYGNLPFSVKKVSGRVKDIVHLNKESDVIPWTNSYYSFENYGSKIILIENYFQRPADLYIMLGIQKNDELEDEDSED